MQVEDPLTQEATSSFKPGDPVLLRFTRWTDAEGARPLREPYFVVPMRVVRDAPDVTMLFACAGTPIRKRVHADGRSIPRDTPYAERLKLDMVVGEGVWTPFHTLSIVPAGAAYDIRYVWHQDDWSFQGWYINLQEPLHRVATGFDSDDWLLDMTADPDRAWEWKDEEELIDAVAEGAIAPEHAATIRAVGEAVIPLIEARAFPFDGSLIDWRPDPAWGPLPMPEDWAQLAEGPDRD